ncbi:hypothetical protein D3C84_1110280 [compost metagenome]
MNRMGKVRRVQKIILTQALFAAAMCCRDIQVSSLLLQGSQHLLDAIVPFVLVHASFREILPVILDRLRAHLVIKAIELLKRAGQRRSDKRIENIQIFHLNFEFI